MRWTPNSAYGAAGGALLAAMLGCASDDGNGDDAGQGTTAPGATSEDPGPSSTATGQTDSDAPGESETTDGGTSSGGDESGGAHTISGKVTRVDSLTLWEGNDGIGTIYLAASAECVAAAPPVAVVQVADADLSSPGGEAAFSLAAVPAGTYYLAGFLDDNANVDPAAPAPDLGDLVLANGAAMGCVEVTVEGADVSDVEVELNFVLPF